MPDSTYDCIVIGSGPGGYVTAIRAAQLGLKTAVVEKDKVGGRCLNYACIPAKAVLRVADVASEIADADEFGITVNAPVIDFAKVLERRNNVVNTLTGGVAGLMKKNQDRRDRGRGVPGPGFSRRCRSTGPSTTAKTVVLATGSVKRPIPGTSFGGRVIRHPKRRGRCLSCPVRLR